MITKLYVPTGSPCKSKKLAFDEMHGWLPWRIKLLNLQRRALPTNIFSYFLPEKHLTCKFYISRSHYFPPNCFVFLFSLPTFCRWKMNLSTVGQQQRSNSGGLAADGTVSALTESCGSTWLPPSGLARSSAAWRWTYSDRSLRLLPCKALILDFAWGFIYPPNPNHSVGFFNTLGESTVSEHVLCHPHCKPAVLWINRQRTLPSSAAPVTRFQRWN